MTLPSGISVLADDASVRPHRHDDEIHGRVLENRAISGARKTEFFHHGPQCLGTRLDLAFQLVGETPEHPFRLDALGDVAPIDRDALAGWTRADRHPGAGDWRWCLEGDHALLVADAMQHLLVQCADELREAVPDHLTN